MFEKVNPSHPDKIADRIAGSIVDLAYAQEARPKIAVEVLIGHSRCFIIIETSKSIDETKIIDNVKRISKNNDIVVDITQIPQDKHLAVNQQDNEFHCGDNGIFKGTLVTDEQQKLTDLVGRIYEDVPYDGKYIIDAEEKTIISCQSNIVSSALNSKIWDSTTPISFYDWNLKTNPLGYWTGGIDVDSGATNRKLGSDMGDSVTGGGLHGKDLSKADVTLNIVAFLEAQESLLPIELKCSIGQHELYGKKYDDYIDIARNYIESIGGFEKFAEWGLIRPKNICKK